MRFLGTEEVYPAYLDFIVSDKYRRAVAEAFYERLFGELRSKWDVLVLSELPAESLSIDHLSEFAECDGKVVQVADPISSPTITLPKHVDEFLSSIGRNERYNLQRKRKRLDRAGAVSWERIIAPLDFSKAMDSFVWLHQTRWEGKGEAGAFKRSKFEAFHQEIGKLFAEQQWSSIDLLKLDGEPIAGIYGYRYNGRYYYYLPGFNHNVLSEASPGTLLLFHCVEQAIASGLAEFDLLRGAMPYKLAWANALRRCLTLKIYNRHLGSVVSLTYGSVRDFGKILLR
jgi:CelD/BcsL family acetyltransferase involved in cellulose biosynthesis